MQTGSAAIFIGSRVGGEPAKVARPVTTPAVAASTCLPPPAGGGAAFWAVQPARSARRVRDDRMNENLMRCEDYYYRAREDSGRQFCGRTALAQRANGELRLKVPVRCGRIVQRLGHVVFYPRNDASNPLSMAEPEAPHYRL